MKALTPISILFFLISLLLLSACTPITFSRVTKTVTKVNTSFEPSQVSREIEPGLRMTVAPVDATTVDSLTAVLTTLDGHYDKIYTDVEGKYKVLLKSMKRKKPDKWAKRYATLLNMAEQGVMPPEVIDAFIRLIFDDENGSLGFEEGYKALYPSLANPFVMNGKSLAIFKVTLTNTTQTNKILDLGIISLLAGTEQLTPFPTGFFENLHSGDEDRTLNTHRLNMPSRITIPPGTTVVKYMATPPLPADDGFFTIQLRTTSSQIPFSFDKTTILSSFTQDYDQFNFKPTPTYNLSYYYVMVTPSGQAVPLSKDYVFISDARTDESHFVYGVAFSKKRTYIGSSFGFKPMQQPERSLKIKFQRYK